MPTVSDTLVDVEVTRWADHELFRGLDPAFLKGLISTMETLVFHPGEVIIRQGEAGHDMYLLESGSVRIRIDDRDGRPTFQTVLEAPQIVGEMALVTKEPRNATVMAESDARTLRVSKRAFASLVKEHPSAAAFLTRAVGRRLMDANGIRQVGKYRVVGHLGAGGLATVFEAQHPHLDQRVALKMLTHDLVFAQGFSEAFKREARLVASLEHPHIVRVIDTAAAYGTFFIVMERLNGAGLDELIERGTRLAPEAMARLLAEVCEALHYCHGRGLLHRDVKPGNVFLTQDGLGKLLDFNIAISAAEAAQATARVTGTPKYMSPEQVQGLPLDGRTDLYSLGITAWELLAGYPPFDAESPADTMRLHLRRGGVPDVRTAAPDTPAWLAAWIARAAAQKPADRFATCAEAAAELRTAVELPVVRKLALTTLAVSYHPSRKPQVMDALRRLYDELRDTPGVALIYGHQGGEDEPR